MSDPKSHTSPTLPDLRAAAEEDARRETACRNAPMRRGLETFWLAPRTLVRLRNWLAVPRWDRFNLILFFLLALMYLFGKIQKLAADLDQKFDSLQILIAAAVYFPLFLVLCGVVYFISNAVIYHNKQVLERQERRWQIRDTSTRYQMLFYFGIVLVFAMALDLFEVRSALGFAKWNTWVAAWGFVVMFGYLYATDFSEKKLKKIAAKRRRYCSEPRNLPTSGLRRTQRIAL